MKGLAESMGLPDWEYRDVPWTDDEVFQRLVDGIGESNIKVLAMTRVKGKGRVRGQILISPQGMVNLIALKESEEKKAQS